MIDLLFLYRHYSLTTLQLLLGEEPHARSRSLLLVAIDLGVAATAADRTDSRGIGPRAGFQSQPAQPAAIVHFDLQPREEHYRTVHPLLLLPQVRLQSAFSVHTSCVAHLTPSHRATAANANYHHPHPPICHSFLCTDALPPTTTSVTYHSPSYRTSTRRIYVPCNTIAASGRKAMDSAQQGWDEPDRPFLTFQSPRTGSLKRKTTHVSRATPGAFPNFSSSSDLSSASDATDIDSRTTTPPHRLTTDESGLPPTPPTMTNSEVAESNNDHLPLAPSPAPLFADRVRNALQVHKSAPTTPIHEQKSPPTPDPSPPTNRIFNNDKLRIPRPELNHYPSSYADSFKTAQEGASVSGSTSQIDLVLPAETTPTQERRSWKDVGRAMGLSNAPLAVQDTEQAHDSDVEQPRVKTYHESSDSDSAKASLDSVKASHEHGSDPAGDDRSTPDSQPSPTLPKSLHQQAAAQRLRKPFQPGDEIKRPNESLLYGSSASVKWKEGRANMLTPPQREMDTEFLRNAQPVVVNGPSEKLQEARSKLQKSVALELQDNDQALTALPPLPLEERRVMSPESHANTAQKLRELSPVVLRRDVESQSPPTTTQKSSLEENNKVYKMIQEENAKRHSSISDGSVRATINAVPERKRKLRHAPKRDSLRGEMSVVDSKRSSSDGSHRLRHKHGMDLLGSDEALVPSEAPIDHTPPRINARISRIDSGENGFDHWSTVPMLRPSKVRSVATAKVLGNPHTLRRSSRQHSIDQRSVSDSARPLSTESDTFEPPSPQLRRSSADTRLDRNMDVRRTSLGREPEIRMEKLAEEAPKDEVEIRDSRDERVSFRERASSVKTAATSPRRKSFDMRHLYPITTPMSISQWSATEAEVCEAKGVELYPHNNESLLLVQSGYRRVSAPAQIAEVRGETPPEVQQPTFQAFVNTPLSADQNTAQDSEYKMDSPLTNPRAAPAPPVIQFIPPTPNYELENELEQAFNATPAIPDPKKNGVQRRVSLTQRMRRYSESLIQPFPFGRSGSLRRNQQRHASQHNPDERPTHLSSFWQPRDFWAEYDSDDEEEGPHNHEPLPPGGDTSSLTQQSSKRFPFLPRNMSVRMPGFRGTGGFLVGNSLGIDRHGTNKRRHYIAARTSQEMLRRTRKGRTFKFPLIQRQVELVGLREKMRLRRERQAEKRREELRGRIKEGGRVWHDGRCGIGVE